MSEERETEIVTGVVGGIIQKAVDKWQIEVTPAGSQYSKKLWTKSQDQVNTATGLIGQVATFECNVSHWTNSDNKPIRSLWVNAINPGTPPPQAAAASVRETVSSDPRQDSIERQTALKAAVELYVGLRPTGEPGSDVTPGVVSIAERFLMFLRGVAENTPEAKPKPSSEDNPPDPTPPGGDEDIPF